jgi:Spy/CpxP family protein refolding chaperone
MKANLKVLIFLFSIILNVVFIGTFAAHKIPIFNWDRKADESMKPPFLQLDLTAEQMARFKFERDKFISELHEMGQAVGKKQIELIDLLAASPPDQRAIQKKQEEIQRLQAATQDRVIVHLIQESSLLNPEQRTRFFQLVKARIESSVQAYPPFMRSFGRCQPGVSNNE